MAHHERVGEAQAEEKRYRLLVEAVTDYAIYMVDRDGYVSSWNSGAARIKGYAPGEILGKHFSVFYADEDRQAGGPERALEMAAREGRFEAEGWRVRKDGGRFWAHVVIDPIRDEAGELIGFAKITRDLSERLQAAAVLERSEEQFRLLVQSVTDYAIYMLDAEGRIASWNAGAQRIKGYRPDEIIGQHFSRFYTEEDAAAGEPARGLGIAAREGRFEKEGWRVRKDGTRFWANIVIDAIRDDAGKLIGFAKVTRDITERREAQRELEKVREAFFQAQKMEAIGQLTGGVAHDFNNLLMVIIGSLEMLRKHVPSDPRASRLIENALQGARRGASLTQRMLAFARRQELTLTAVDVPELVRSMMDLLMRSLGPTVTLETRFPGALDAVQADANQLELTLLNLVVNARDAMPDGGAIVIEAQPVEIADAPDGLKPGRYVRLAVSDTGVGMDEATVARAVEPFFTTKGVGKGTGLGLSMVHGTMEQLGGRMTLKSRPGEGTTVELWMPVSETPALAGAFAARRDAAHSSDDLHRFVALAVDDDPLVLVNTTAMLEDLGFTVFPAASGDEALATLRREPTIDFVITDHAMPQMTGVELARAIRVERPDLPIILTSGYAELSENVDISLPKLAKPFAQGEIVQVIAAAMSNRTPAAHPDHNLDTDRP